MLMIEGRTEMDSVQEDRRRRFTLHLHFCWLGLSWRKKKTKTEDISTGELQEKKLLD